jgi:hypothetical protein
MIGTMRDPIDTIEIEHLRLVRTIAEEETERRIGVTRIAMSPKIGKIGTRGLRDLRGTRGIRISKQAPNLLQMTEA